MQKNLQDSYVGLRMDTNTLTLLDKFAKRQGCSRSDLIRLFVKRGLDSIVRHKKLLAELTMNSPPDSTEKEEVI